jgi:DNA-binding NtrC family response regulator
MSAAAKPVILFVDDEPRVLTSMRMLFRNTYQVLIAESGVAALGVLKDQAVDVIVSDQRMPGMTGIELLRRARDLQPGAMRILLTGYSDLNAIIGSINEGEIFRFVNKPWINDDLGGTLARAVDAARATAAAERDSHTVAPANAVDLNGPAVLVLDEDPAVAPQLQRMLGGGVRVVAARSMEAAVREMESQDIGVVVSDTRVQDHPVVSLIGTLKQHHPELVSVILTERADAGAAIDLINQGQIYRFITKPLSESQCKITVSSALRQHQRLAAAPVLHQRYQVSEPVEPPPPTSPAGGLLDRIRGLRNRVWGRSA